MNQNTLRNRRYRLETTATFAQKLNLKECPKIPLRNSYLKLILKITTTTLLLYYYILIYIYYLLFIIIIIFFIF